MVASVEMTEITSKVVEGAPNPIVAGVGDVLDAATTIYVTHDALANYLPYGKKG